MRTKEQIRQQINGRIAQFRVGDWIEFEYYDDTGCNENTGDPIRILLHGCIIGIEGIIAHVEYQFGNAVVNLSSAKRLGNADEVEREVVDLGNDYYEPYERLDY